MTLVYEALTISRGQKNKIKRLQKGKEEVEVFYIHDIILHIKDSKILSEKMLELINSLAKWHEIKLTYKSSRHLVFQKKNMLNMKSE